MLRPETVDLFVWYQAGSLTCSICLSALFVQTESGDSLEIVQADGLNSSALLNTVLPGDQGLAGMAWLSGEVEIDAELKLESDAMPADAMAGLRSAVAIPLIHEQQPFAILALYKDQPLEANSTLPW